MSWPSIAFGELADFLSGNAWSAPKFNSDGRGVPVIRIQNVSTADSTFLYWDEPFDHRFLIEKGDILLTLSGSFRTTIWDGPRALLNQRIVKISPTSRLDQRYLLHYLSRKLGDIERMGRHALVNNVSLADLKAIPIPLPPLDEQRRIAGILDLAEELRAKRRAAIALLNQLPQSIFLEMFGDPVTNPKGWPNTQQLSDFAQLVSGITKGRKVNGQAVREIPYMAVVNVQDKRLNLESVKSIAATEAEINRYRLQRDDLLLTEGGDPDKLGRGSLWGSELPEAIHQNHVFRVRITSDRVSPLYLSWLIGSTYGKAYFLRQAKQTTGIATMNMGQLKSFPLLLPPSALQRQFADRVEIIHRAKAEHQSALAQLDALFASLQSIAFAGAEMV